MLNGTRPPFLIAASLDAVKRKLAQAEALEAAAGGSLPHRLHPFSFVRLGLEIEDQQCVARVTSYQHTYSSDLGNRLSSI